MMLKQEKTYWMRVDGDDCTERQYQNWGLGSFSLRTGRPVRADTR